MEARVNCPHCKKEINPASIMGKESAKKRDTSSEAMRKLVNKRWSK